MQATCARGTPVIHAPFSTTRSVAELVTCRLYQCAVSMRGCALQAANVRGIPVFNAPFSNTRSVAELVICEVIALARQLGDRSAELHR